MLSIANISLLVREAVQSFNKDNGPRLAAALTYFSIFALIPILILAVVFITSLLTDISVQQRIVDAVSDNLGKDFGEQLGIIIAEQRDNLDVASGITSGLIVGLAALAWTASNLFVQLQMSLNDMWNVPPEATGGIGGMLMTRLKGLGIILMLGAVMLTFFGLNTYLSAAGGPEWMPEGIAAFGLRVLTFALSVTVLTGVFAVIYRVLPNVKLEWRDVLTGSAITAVLFTLLQLAISWYFANFAPGSAFGAYSSVILGLLWIFYNSMLLFFGAELTFAYAKHFGSAEASRSAQIKEAGTLSEAEARAIAYAAETGRALSPQDRQRAWTRATKVEQPHTMLQVTQTRRESVTPSVLGTAWNAISAVFALPAVLVVKALGLGFSREVPERRRGVRTEGRDV